MRYLEQSAIWIESNLADIYNKFFKHCTVIKAHFIQPIIIYKVDIYSILGIPHLHYLAHCIIKQMLSRDLYLIWILHLLIKVLISCIESSMREHNTIKEISSNLKWKAFWRVLKAYSVEFDSLMPFWFKWLPKLFIPF